MGLSNWLLGGQSSSPEPARACLLFVDGENRPPDPLLLVQEVEQHALARLDLRVAYGKWWPQANNTKNFIAAGFECIMADEGANNADLLLSNRVHNEVRERSSRGQTGTLYVAFHSDKGYGHLFNSLKAVNTWKIVFVTTNQEPNDILVNSADEILTIGEPETGSASGPAPESPDRAMLQSKVEKIAKEIILSSDKRPVNRSWFISKLKHEVRGLGFETLSELKLHLGHQVNTPHTVWLGDGVDLTGTTEIPAGPESKSQPLESETEAIELLRAATRAIVTKPLRVVQFTGLMTAFISRSKHPDLKTRDLYVRCGAPRSWTTLKVLEKFAPDLVEWDEGARGNEAVLRPVGDAPAS